VSPPHVARIDLFPIKGFDAVTVDRASVLPSGALAGDRRWAFVDGRDRFVNGKQFPAIHPIRTSVDLAAPSATFDGVAFPLAGDVGPLEAWLSSRLETPVQLREHAGAGFPDDTDSPGPTLVATATLEAVAGWFGLGLAETRARFRANVEIGGVPAFWEDAWYGHPCRIGDGGVALTFVNPCARCVVPSRHPWTGEALPGFQKRFADLRRAALAADVDAAPFTHTYRLAVNTRACGRRGAPSAANCRTHAQRAARGRT
jgi:uncharacterized protein YcbX